MVRDAIGLVYALGHRSVAMLVGHDAGSPVASWASLIRPDIFHSVVLMSSPFGGPPSLPAPAACRAVQHSPRCNLGAPPTRDLVSRGAATCDGYTSGT